MGLAASQARLLSLTTRINHNEMESMVTTNAKLRLASKTDEAQDKYLSVLDSTKLEYALFDNSGLQQSSALTFNAVNKYDPLKNQYIFKNASNQVYVNSTDAKNFEASNDLYEFLDKYGLFDQGELEFQDKLDAYNKEKAEYDKEMADYQAQLDKFNKEFADYSQKLEDYNNALDLYNRELEQYEKDYQEWLAAQNQTDLYKIFSDAVGTSDMKDGPEPSDPSKQCYWHALQARDTNDCSCYTHVLQHIIDYDASTDMCGNNGNNGIYTTSYGDDITIRVDPGGYMNDTVNEEMEQVSNGINEKDSNGEYLRKCDGTDDYQGVSGISNRLEKARADYQAGTINETQYKLQVLLSDYVYNNGNYELKSLKQKAIDLYYVSMNWQCYNGSGEFSEADLSRETMIDMLINFTDGDMQKLTVDEPEMPTPPEPFDMEKPTFDLQMPMEPKKPEYTERIYDKPLAQWYINLWYAMDASDESDVLYSVQEEGEDIYYTVPDVMKETTQEANRYIVIDDEQLNDENWLQNALTNGQITMSQAVYGLNADGNIVWTSIQSNNVSEITEVQDTEKIAKAEAEYQYTVSELQIQDNQFDIELKKLDTEHNALQQQFDAIKSVIDKNTERTFKMFS